jgi:hypothetical protein
VSSITARFEAALVTLVGDGPIKQRLAEAWTRHLAAIKVTDLPHPLANDFRCLRSAMERVRPCGSESVVRASVRKMSAREAGDHAGTILVLFRELARTSPRVEPLKIVGGDAETPPRYLAARGG